MNLGELIYNKRKEKGMTQEGLAETLNVARQTISKWETNETVPDLVSLKKLAVILNFSIDEALEIDSDDEDDKIEWLIIGGFIIGNSLGLLFNNFYLGYVFAMIGLALGFIIKALKNK